MHARNRTWLLGSDPVERCRQRTLPVEGGDGSTLSLDFTTGVLDPRIAFTRTSNATFINSQGYVEYANSNMFWNTAFEGLSGTNPSLTGSGWNYVVSSGSAVFNGDSTVTMTTTSAQRIILYRSSGFSGAGLRIISSVDVIIHSGSLQVSQLMLVGTPTNDQHYVNGIVWNSSHPKWSVGGILPINETLNISYATDSNTSGTTSMTFGVGCSSVIAGSATFSNPRLTMWKGSGSVPYYPNTSATNNSPSNNYKSADYQAPRFDYDPSALTPRGLLIEGSAINYVTQSNGSTSVWTVGANRTPTNNTTDLSSPDGTNNATKLVCGTAGQYASYATSILGLTGGGTYTVSYWIKGPSGHTPRLYAQNGTVGDVTASSTTGTYNNTGWTRITQTYTFPATTTQVLVYFLSANIANTGDTFYVYGFQLEAGSGASSYIPTGASTVTRTSDVANMTGANFLSWFTQGAGTIVAHSDNVKTNTRNLIGQISNAGTTYIQMGNKALAGAGEAIGYLLSGSIEGYVDSNNNPALNTAYKTAYVWDTNFFNVCVNGTLATADTAGNIASSGMTQMCIGADSTVPTDVYIKNGHIRSLKYYPLRLPNSQLQSLTT